MNGINNKELNKELIALLLVLAKEDNHFDENEFLFILKVSETMGISPEEMRIIQLNLNNFDFSSPRTEADRMTILYYLLFCMKSDHNIDPKEVEFVERMGFKLGFRPQLTNDLIQSVKSHIKSSMHPEELLSTIRKYLN